MNVHISLRIPQLIEIVMFHSLLLDQPMVIINDKYFKSLNEHKIPIY